MNCLPEWVTQVGVALRGPVVITIFLHQDIVGHPEVEMDDPRHGASRRQ